MKSTRVMKLIEELHERTSHQVDEVDELDVGDSDPTLPMLQVIDSTEEG